MKKFRSVRNPEKSIQIREFLIVVIFTFFYQIVHELDK